jgi:DNA-directed RNA polymerase subunit K/omega
MVLSSSFPESGAALSDFSNFHAVYNELTDAVMSSRYQFFKDHLANFFDTIDQTPNAAAIVSELESRVDLMPWYEESKNSVGSFVGSGMLDWPKDRTDRLAMKVALLRALSSEQIDIFDFTSSFLYTANNFDTNVSDVAQQIFQPTVRELIRYIEERFDKAVPAADRAVTVNHNSREYADADEAMEKLEKAIHEANDFDDPLEKEQREAEISAARRLIRASLVRVAMVVELIKPVVTKYITQVRDGIVANMASATVAALGVLLGYAFKALIGL